MKGALIGYEVWVALAVVLAALLLPRAFSWGWPPLRRALVALGRHPARLVLACALLAGLGSAALALLVQRPEPRIHDEFSYLLQADTFAHGRLANPTPPQWESFETFQVLMQPTYASKYPPAQGAVLALGQVLAGDPLVGLWLSAAAMAAALAWMLLAWLPPRWAALAALLATAHLGVATYWTQSYWGGAVAAAAGALVFGALPRLVRASRPRWRDALALGAGLVLLANSRPWEGLIVALPAAAVMAAWVLAARRAGGALRRGMRRAVLAVALVLAAGAAWMLRYDAAVTGDPLTMPYVVYEQRYVVAPPFLWLPLRPTPEYRLDVLRAFWTGFYLDEYLDKRTPAGLLIAIGRRSWNLWSFFLGPLLSVPLLALLIGRRRRAGIAASAHDGVGARTGAPRVARGGGGGDRRRWLAIAAVACGGLFVVLLGSTYYGRHYLAPATGPLWALVGAGLRQLHGWRPRGRRVGRALVVGLVAACVLRLAAHVAVHAEPPDRWHFQRARMAAALARSNARHLVLVRYGSRHDTTREWVFNAADIGSAPVIWAHDRGEDANARLMAAYPGRRTWLLLADSPKPRLSPYPGPGG